MSIDVTNLEFLASTSKELIEKQISSYRQKHSNAGIIIGVSALFMPFFLNGLDDSILCLQYLSILPIGLFATSIILLLRVLMTKPLYQSFKPEKLDSLKTATNSDTLNYVIDVNKLAYQKNRKIIEDNDKYYDRGIVITIIAILISSFMLFASKVLPQSESPIQVKILNTIEMSGKKAKKGISPKKAPNKSSADEIKSILTVDEDELEKLSQSVNRKPIKIKPSKHK